MVSGAFDAGEISQSDFELEEDNDLEIVFSMGQNLNHENCNDAPYPEIEVLVEKTYLPVKGSLSITIEPTGEETEWGELPADATIHLQSVDFCVENHHEDCFTIEDLQFSTAVGWLPG